MSPVQYALPSRHTECRECCAMPVTFSWSNHSNRWRVHTQKENWAKMEAPGAVTMHFWRVLKGCRVLVCNIYSLNLQRGLLGEKKCTAAIALRPSSDYSCPDTQNENSFQCYTLTRLYFKLKLQEFCIMLSVNTSGMYKKKKACYSLYGNVQNVKYV